MKRSLWFLLAICWLAALLRFYRVADMPLRADEASSLYLSLGSPASMVQVFATTDPHMPIYFLILHYWTLVAGISELAARFVAIFVGVLCVPLTYALGRQTFSRRENIALLGAALMAINPFLIWDAQDIYMYSSLTAATLVSLVLFLRLRQAQTRWWHWLGYIVSSIVGLYLHYFFAFILLAQAGIAAYRLMARQIDWRGAAKISIAQFFVALCFLPWLALAWSLLTSFHSDFIPPSSFIEMLQRTLVTFTVGRADTRMAPAWVDPTIGSLLSLGFLAIFFIGLFLSPKKIDAARVRSENAGRIVLMIFLGVPLAAFFIYSLARFPLFDERYVLYISAGFALILARGLANLLESSSRRGLALGACAFILLADGYALNNYFHVPEFARSPDWHSFMNQLTASAQPGDVLIQNYPDPALPYYLQNKIPRVLLPRTGAATAEEVDADLIRLTAKSNRVWLQPAPYAEWDTNGFVETWLTRHAKRTNRFDFRGLALELFLPGSVALSRANSIDALFAQQIRLVAFDQTGALEPGNTVNVTLYWSAANRITQSLTVFVHLYDAQGYLVAQQDTPPVSGTFPTDAWEPNTLIVDQHQLAIPAGTRPAFLGVGLYDSQTLARLAVTDAQGHSLDDRIVRLEQR